MPSFAKIAAAIGVVGAIGISCVLPASADYYGHRHRYYNYYGGYGGDPNGCPAAYSLQGGHCAPYKGPVGGGPNWPPPWYR
jgi:hypothetical protein